MDDRRTINIEVADPMLSDNHREELEKIFSGLDSTLQRLNLSASNLIKNGKNNSPTLLSNPADAGRIKVYTEVLADIDEARKKLLQLNQQYQKQLLVTGEDHVGLCA